MSIGRFFKAYLLIIILIIEFLCAINVKWGGERWKEMVSFDGKGYYAYLPSIFIYHNLHYSFHDSIEKKYSSPKNFYDYRVLAGNGIINKYFSGTALAILPFFLIAHSVTILTGGLADGYSLFYMLAISIASLFYCFLGLFFLGKILRQYAIPENIIATVIITILFGTQLFYYTVFDPSLSHVYSFAAITVFVYFLKCYLNSFKRRDLVLAGFFLGWIILIRPVNGIIILITPFLSGSWNNFLAMVKVTLKNKLSLYYSFCIFIVIVSIQGIIYYFQSGNFFNDSYVVEGFNWGNPQILNILFSYKKGLFIYTPVLFISLAGIVSLYRKSPFSSWSIFLFLLIISYVFSCWWSWWYGGSFSSRPFTEFLSLFAILLAILLLNLRSRLMKGTAFLLLFLCIVLCQVQTYQFRYYIIHWEKMDKEHYWRVFMRIDHLLVPKKINPNADLINNETNNGLN